MLKGRREGAAAEDESVAPQPHASPGRGTRVEKRYGAVQKKAAPGADPSSEVASDSAQTGGQSLPGSTQSRMESLFGTDFSDVRVHEGQEAPAKGAQAYAQGSDLHFAPGKLQPDTQKGDYLLAHELTHVVQQRAGGGATQAKAEPGSATKLGDRELEAEADRVASMVVANQSVAGQISGRAGGDAPVAQHFESDEHAEIGDDATKGAHGEKKTVELAADYRITFGEMVAMAGDYFANIGQMRTLAANPGKGAGTREELEYVRVVKIHGNEDAEDNYSESARKAADKRYYGLAADNRSHFLNPNEGDTGRSTKDKIHDQVDDKSDFVALVTHAKKPSGAPGYYRHGHIRALAEAGQLAKTDAGIDTAMAVEAFSAHYLTDMFAAGHTRTPRGSASDYWNAKCPMFFYNFKGFLAESLAYYINNHNWRGVATVDYINEQALGTLESTLEEKGMPDFKFGDLVAGAIHDYDNQMGVPVMIDGQPKRLYGDGHLHEGDTKDMAMQAVRAGVSDVERYYAARRSGLSVHDAVAPLLHDGLFSAERLIPVVKPDAELPQQDQSVNWNFPDVGGLFSDRKFREGLKIFLSSKKSELAKVGASLDADYKKEAFQRAVIDKMTGESGIKLVWKVLQWTPNTGGGVGGHNQDDNALAYYNKAKSTPGGLASLFWSARANLIKDLVDGATWGDEEDACYKLMTTASDADAQKVIDFVGWDRLEDELGSRFRNCYPRDQYKKQT